MPYAHHSVYVGAKFLPMRMAPPPGASPFHSYHGPSPPPKVMARPDSGAYGGTTASSFGGLSLS